MSQQTDEIDNIIASLTNVNAALKAQEAGTPVAPDLAVGGPVETVAAPPAAPAEAPAETPAEESTEEASEAPAPTDGTVADNTPSASTETPAAG